MTSRLGTRRVAGIALVARAFSFATQPAAAHAANQRSAGDSEIRDALDLTVA
jgi:hypothetical protein